MTFKHVKFEDSPTMRALEKVAREKGLVKPEPLNKTASAPKKLNYTPTANLMENVLNLCAGLRSQGLVKEAAELETNYLNYKQAQTLYETSKETGEDLLQTAHPDGSHKLEGLEGDALVEDLLEKHEKIMSVVNKNKPSGKLSSSAQTINEVKKALGQFAQHTETPSGGEGGQQAPAPTTSKAKQEMLAAAKDMFNALTIAQKGGGLTGIVMSDSWGRYNVVSGVANSESPSPDQINDAISAIHAVQRWLHPNLLHNYLPDILNKGVSTDALWQVISQKLDSAEAHCNNAIRAAAQELSKSSSIRRMEKLLAIAQADPEALKKGKAAMIQALQLVDRGLGELLNVYYGDLLKQEKPDIDAARKELSGLVQKINATGDGDFPNQLMNDISSEIFGIKKEIDKQRNEYSSGDRKVDDANWWRKFNYASSLIGQGQSMSWGASAAINDGDLRGLQFHAAHLSSDEVMTTLRINLERPLNALKSTLSGINVEQIRSPQMKQFYPQLVEDLNAAVTSTQNAINGVMNASDASLRVIHPSKIVKLFAAPLDKDDKGRSIFGAVNSLDSLKAKCVAVVNIYTSYVNMIKKAAGV